MKFAPLLAVLASLTFGHASGGFRSVGTSAQPSPSASPIVPFIVVEQWNIELDPRGGYGRVIVVDAAQRSEAGLLALAEQLRADTNADRAAVVYIYDDPTAATMRKGAANETVSQADLKWHDDHMIGIYSKILRVGRPPIMVTMTLDGAGGASKDVSLP